MSPIAAHSLPAHTAQFIRPKNRQFHKAKVENMFWLAKINKRAPMGKPVDLARFWFNSPAERIAKLNYPRPNSAISRPAPCNSPAQHNTPPPSMTEARIQRGHGSASAWLSRAAAQALQAAVRCSDLLAIRARVAFSQCWSLISIRT
jgi:hypothetical protein